jgi:glycosyltransferase involved in cell wall biosynthesis
MPASQPSEGAPPDVSVLVPARNEESCLRDCLQSLVSQSGVAFELILVDDHSTDRTAEIAHSFPRVKIVPADPLPAGWCGKQNALNSGVREARGRWLLFTDADTVHAPDSLRRALDEALQHGVALLSYSPEQELHTLWERAVMPVIFAELARAYPLQQVSDPQSPIAAANGQYLLITREAYDAVGGHAAVRSSLLEDVELARAVKQSGRAIRFRFGRGLVRTRMYRSFRAMFEGWNKNLALLFPNPIRLAFWRLAELYAILIGAMVGSTALLTGKWWLGGIATAVAVALYARFLLRIRKAHFGFVADLLAIFGLEIFAILLLNSAIYYRLGRPVSWRGRSYQPIPRGTHDP